MSIQYYCLCSKRRSLFLSSHIKSRFLPGVTLLKCVVAQTALCPIPPVFDKLGRQKAKGVPSFLPTNVLPRWRRVLPPKVRRADVLLLQTGLPVNDPAGKSGGREYKISEIEYVLTSRIFTSFKTFFSQCIL